tara:strand:+ start:762 stop:1124 length:363 start_codon:yes stop_codon:yes gene_type:complete
MNFKIIKPVRKFEVGGTRPTIELSHVMDLMLEADEQVTLVTEGGKEVDICRKDWGYYATPSLNSRLKRFGYRCCLVDSAGKKFVHIVDQNKIPSYQNYLDQQKMTIVAWLDNGAISNNNA